MIDPLGLALENFDVTGVWRIRTTASPVDPVGDLYDGTKLDGPIALRNALLKHQDVFMLSFTESLMTYALGRRVEYYDMPAIRADRRATRRRRTTGSRHSSRRRQQRRLPHGARRPGGTTTATDGSRR